MSQTPPRSGGPLHEPDAPGPLGSGGVPPSSPPPSPQMATSRRASVQLTRSGQTGQSMEDLAASANKSLSEALGITQRIVVFALFALIGLYMLSGLQSVREGQSAIRLLFGRVQASNLSPGFQWSAPFPIGALVKVDMGAESVVLESQFWPFVDPKSANKSIDTLSKENRLNPERDGSLITAEANLAHAQWRVQYRRLSPADWAQNMLPRDESIIVTAAACRGIVHAVAQTPIEELLRQSAGDTGRVADMAKRVAQRQLDQMDSGIQIERFELTVVTPPMYVRDAFNNVQAATASAQKAVEAAESEANQIFNAKAGEARQPLIAMIDAYELALANADEAGQKKALATIDALIDGTPVEVKGVPFNGRVSGEVAQMMSEARQYRSEIVNRRKAELARFNAKLAQYRSNPSVMLHREWAEALAMFLDRDSVQLLLVPPGTRTLELKINDDQELARRREQENRRQINEKARREREESIRRGQFSTGTRETAEQ